MKSRRLTRPSDDTNRIRVSDVTCGAEINAAPHIVENAEDRCGVTSSCRGHLPGASLAVYLTLRNQIRLPGQRGSLVRADSVAKVPAGPPMRRCSAYT